MKAVFLIAVILSVIAVPGSGAESSKYDWIKQSIEGYMSGFVGHQFEISEKCLDSNIQSKIDATLMAVAMNVVMQNFDKLRTDLGQFFKDMEGFNEYCGLTQVAKAAEAEIEQNGAFSFFMNFAVHFFDIDASLADALESVKSLNWENTGNNLGKITSYIIPPQKQSCDTPEQTCNQELPPKSEAACIDDIMGLFTIIPTLADNGKSLLGGDFKAVQPVMDKIRTTFSTLAKLPVDCLEEYQALQNLQNDEKCMDDVSQMMALTPKIFDKIESLTQGAFSVLEPLGGDVGSFFGILVQLPKDCFKKELKTAQFELPLACMADFTDLAKEASNAWPILLKAATQGDLDILTQLRSIGMSVFGIIGKMKADCFSS